jgi:hypothetical protein
LALCLFPFPEGFVREKALNNAWVAVVATLSGTLLGGGLGYFNGRATEARHAAHELVNERKLAYIQLLDACRKLRYGARRLHEKLPSPSRDEFDSWRTQASDAAYEIEILSSKATGRVANKSLKESPSYSRRRSEGIGAISAPSGWSQPMNSSRIP